MFTNRVHSGDFARFAHFIHLLVEQKALHILSASASVNIWRTVRKDEVEKCNLLQFADEKHQLRVLKRGKMRREEMSPGSRIPSF